MITEYEKISDTETRIVATCQLDGSEATMVLPMSVDAFRTAFVQWQNGTLIQNAFPNLDAGQREFIMTGITPQKWEELF